MDAADLDYRARTLSGCVPPHLVSRLFELGHAEEVEFLAGRGEWFCAREQARLLGGKDQQAQALDVLAPYVATGWWKAVETMAGLLEGWGRGEEAIALVRPYAEAQERSALEFAGRLLARHGRGDEGAALPFPGFCALTRFAPMQGRKGPAAGSRRPKQPTARTPRPGPEPSCGGS
ncbi:hypothetical protein AB0O86_29870 [Streptomyces hirsutus]|uniref:hypothetical protein n=1 Tax=Streptomyces hirsutus TaxID=35620 RepID=UPI003445B3A8